MLTVDNLVFGLEIETQNCTDGKPDELDPDNYRDELVEAVEERLQNISRRTIRNAIRDSEIITVDPDEVWQTLEERLLSDWESDDEAQDINPDCEHWYRQTDGTVKGYEYTFRDPKNWGESIIAIDTFPWNEAEIDLQCSHHIHVSWDGISTTTTRQVKLYLATIYLLHKASQELRVKVEERLDQKDRWCERYFRPTVSNGRYCAIAQRDVGNGTYEFRFFGGIDNAELSKEAMRLVADAVILACKDVFFNMAEIKNAIDNDWHFGDEFKEACEGKLPQELAQMCSLFATTQEGV